MQSVCLQRIMKINAAKGYEKTKPKQTQFKPNSNPIQTQTNPILSADLSADLSGEALAKSEALAKADSNPARNNLPKISQDEFFLTDTTLDNIIRL
ncbi:hypothetical protein ES703_112205 [subsurface metagenome]